MSLNRNEKAAVITDVAAQVARSQTLALSVTSDGEVSLIRQTDADFRITVNLAAFPFDRQKLDFVFTAPRYAASEVIFSIEDRDRALSSISKALSASDWHPKGLGFALDQFYGWNAKPFVRATVTATVSRAWRQEKRRQVPSGRRSWKAMASGVSAAQRSSHSPMQRA